MKKWEEDILYLSDYDRKKEEEIRRTDIYSFYFGLSDRKRRADKNKPNLTENFGR